MNIFQKIFGSKTIATMVPTWQEGKPTYPSVSYEKMVREGYRKNELMFSCIEAKSNTASQVSLKVYSKSTNKEMPTHPLSQLIRSPNPGMSEYDFWRSVIIYQDLAGRACYEKERNRSGQTVRLWPLRPDWLHPIPSSTSFLSGYIYEVPTVGEKRLKVDDVLDFKIFDPLDQYNSFPPIAVAARVGSVDNSATDYIKLFFERGGVPPGVIKTTQRLRDNEITDIRRRWAERYGGVLGWLQPAILDRDAEYQQTGLSFKDMGFDSLDARDEARICAVLRVPPMIVGAKIGLDRSTFTNYKEARTAWWEDTLVPIYVDFISTMGQGLMYEFPDVYLRWDFTNVPAMREEKLVLWQRANEALRWGGLTINEYRSELGFDSIGDPGDIFLRPLNMVEVGLDGSITQLASDTEQGSENEPEENDEEMNEDDMKMLVKASSPSDRTIRLARERMLGRKLEKYFSDQRALVEKELNSNAPAD